MLKRSQIRRKRPRYDVAQRTDGYASKLEAAVAARFELLKSSAVPHYRVMEVRSQVPVKLEVNGQLICTYIVDFWVRYADGRIEWVEAKGFETETWKLKEKLFRALFPERVLVVVRKA